MSEKNKKKVGSRRIGLGVAAVLVVLAILYLENPFAERAIQGSPPADTKGIQEGVEVGQRLPNFRLQTIDSNTISLSDYLGKPVVVNFWATWCPFCVDEMPDLQRAHEEAKGNAIILGINRAEAVTKQKEFLNDLGMKITYLLLLDPNDDIAKAYGVRVMPTTFFLDENGVITSKKLGQASLSEIRSNIEKSSKSTSLDLPKSIPERQIKVTNGKKHLVPLEKILSGGPPMGGIGVDVGIPAIINPKFIKVEEASDFLNDEDLVLGLVFNDIARAYPHQILVWHEIVNDEVEGIPILITYCPLCYTGIAFERTVNGEVLKFGTSGKLYNSDLVMYDSKTQSYWSQVLGTAIVGELTGTDLKRIAIDTVPWGNWRKMHPDTQVLSRDTGFSRPYGRDPYGNYYKTEGTVFPVDNAGDKRLFSKAIVYGVTLDSLARAYPKEEVAKVGLLNDELGLRKLLVVYDQALDTVRVFDRIIDGRTLEFILTEDPSSPTGRLMVDKQTQTKWDLAGNAISGQLKGMKLQVLDTTFSFWFSWAAFFPGTSVYTAK